MTLTRPIPGCPGYEADDQGRIWSLSNWRNLGPRLMRAFTAWGGYLRVDLKVDGRTVHRAPHVLVCSAWHGPRPSSRHQVRHLDGTRTNNRPENLVWGTARENSADREAHGRTARRERAGTAVLTSDQVAVVQRLNAEKGVSQEDLATLLGVAQSTIGRVIQGKTWTK